MKLHIVLTVFAVKLVKSARFSSGFDSNLVTCNSTSVLYAEGTPAGFKNPIADLSSHHLFDLLDVGIDASAVQTCYNLHRAEGNWKLDWKKKAVDKLVDFSKGVLNLNYKGRDFLIQPLVANILDWQQPGAKKLIRWAFEHQDGKNPFCPSMEKQTFEERQELRQETFQTYEHFGHLLVSGHGEASHIDSASAMVNKTLSKLITKAIGATLMADCDLRATKVKVEDGRFKWDTSIDWPPVVLRSFELLREVNATAREFYFMQELVNVFQDYVKTSKVDLSSPEIQPEIEGLWKMLGKKSRVYAEAENSFKTSQATTSRPQSCQCVHIAKSISAAFGDRLTKLGFDADSAEDNWVWEATDLSKLLDLFTITETGLENPDLSFLNMLHEANHLPRLPTSEGAGQSKESTQKSMVKGVLVGLPMLQNYLAHLDIRYGGHESIKVNYAKKLKWFLFLNIAWAVWHENMHIGAGELGQRVSLEHRQQNVALGLLVSAFAVVSDFSWDGKLFKEENTDAFNDFNVGLYTVWNYRWVAALFEPRRLQYHFWHGLGLPVLQALGNEKSSAYWVNYRRDGLMAAMMNLSPLREDDEQ